MKEVVCVVCPMGCRLQVDEDNGYAVTGNSCPRGATYGKAEVTNPTRVSTSTVRVRGGLYPRLPVKTRSEVPKAKLMEVMSVLNEVEVAAPVKMGEVVVSDVCGTGVDIVATRDM